MNPALLNYDIIFQSAHTEKDVYGNDNQIFENYIKTKCYKKNLSGNRTELNNSELFNELINQFQIRYNSLINNSLKIIFENDEYFILNIDNVGIKKYLIITAKKNNI
jgi:hypothetical protein